jgi:spore germination cell wall hydrolase CwlJ-like protein
MIKELLMSALTLMPAAYADDASLGAKQFKHQEAFCLAQNVYHEARNQPAAGQMAVMSVTINRVNDERFPNTICEVVYEGPSRPSWKGTGEMIPIRHRCQFSWYCDGKSDTAHDKETFNEILLLSQMVIDGTITLMDITEGATHYHADYVRPSWARTKTKTIEIEDHIFYRWEK